METLRERARTVRETARPARWAAWAEADRERWGLWAPAALLAGVLAYFALADEPMRELWRVVLPAAVLLAIAGFAIRPLRPAIGALVIGCAAAALGAALAQRQAVMATAPVLAAPVETTLTGVIEQVERRGPDALRWTLAIDHYEGEISTKPPRVRVRVDAGAAGAPGDRVRLRARLNPPPGPAAPGAFDPARLAWFGRIGAVGWALDPPEIVEAAAHGAPLSALRERIARRAAEALAPDQAGIAAALTVGDRGAPPEWALEDMRASGLGHLLAISGLHLGMVAGAVFFLLRRGAALIPALALRLPTKKIAAIVAILAAGAYMLLAGATPPTQRAFVLVCLVMLAVLADRRAVGLRLVAIAALAVLAIDPHAATGPSFQMSFAAAAALVAAYEGVKPQRRPGAIYGSLRFVGGIAMATLIAGLATAPFAAFHFHTIPFAGTLANLIAVPLTAFLILPAAMLALLLWPLGLDPPFWAAMGLGIDALLGVAAIGADWPLAQLRVPAFPGWALALMALGALWLMIWRGPLRWIGPGVTLVGVVAAALAPQPLLLASPGGLIGIRGEDAPPHIFGRSGDAFTRSVWRERWGWPDEPRLADPPDGLACGETGCRLTTDGGLIIAMPETDAALAADCETADAVVARRHFAPACLAPILIDRAALRRGGPTAIREQGARLRVDTAADPAEGRRPWTPTRW